MSSVASYITKSSLIHNLHPLTKIFGALWFLTLSIIVSSPVHLGFILLMIKVKGINIYPGQIDTILKEVQGLSSEYQVYLSRKDGRDIMMLKVEKEKVTSACNLDKKLENLFKSKIGIQITAQVVEYGILPRSEKKTKRIYDER